MIEEEEIEELRRRKMLELRTRVEEQQGQAEQRRQYEIQKRLAILQIMTPEARSRLANIRAAKPEFAEQLELQLIQLAQSGRLGSKITDVQLRDILSRLQARKHKFKIKRV